MSALADMNAAPTGAQLVAAIETEAARQGRAAVELAAALSRFPSTFLANVRAARRPKPGTVARIEALLSGRPVPLSSSGLMLSVPGSAVAPTAWRDDERDPPIPHHLRVYRDPCWRCGVRGDLGCAHQAAQG